MYVQEGKGNCGTHRANEGHNGKRRNGSPNNTAPRRRRRRRIMCPMQSGWEWPSHSSSGITSNDKHLVATIYMHNMCGYKKRETCQKEGRLYY